MKQLVVDSLPEVDGVIAIRGEPARYLARVRRVATGDRLAVTDSDGRCGEVELVAVTSRHIAARILSLREAPRTDSLRLVHCLLKQRKTDDVIRQATELGVTEIAVTISERSVSRPTRAELAHKRRRWERIAIEAGQQSGRPGVPRLRVFESLADALAPHDDAPKIAFHQDAARDFAAIPPVPPGSAQVLVGPEGGLSRKEVATAAASDWMVVRLAGSVLRAQTAAIVALALVKYRRTQ